MMNLDVTLENNGSIYVHLVGGTTFDKSTFTSALEEIIRQGVATSLNVLTTKMALLLRRLNNLLSLPRGLVDAFSILREALRALKQFFHWC